MRLDIQSILPLTVNENVAPRNPTANNSIDEAKELLAEGIRAARAGDRAKARVSLLRSVELDKQSESSWLWLASISEYPEELLVFLTNVLDINPENQRAIEWTTATKSLLSKTFVQRGIDAVEEKKADYAVQCFNQALEYDQNNAMAWLWMATLCDSDQGKIAYFERVLNIDPENETARAGHRTAKFNISQRQLAEARAAAVGGKTLEANEFLDAILAENPESEDAWILRAHLAEGFERKITAYENVLQLNPGNVVAKSSLESLLAIVETVTPHRPAAVDYETSEAIKKPCESLEFGPADCVETVVAFEPDQNESVPLDAEADGCELFSGAVFERIDDADVPFVETKPDYSESAENAIQLDEADLYADHPSAFSETAFEWSPGADQPAAYFENNDTHDRGADLTATFTDTFSDEPNGDAEMEYSYDAKDVTSEAENEPVPHEPASVADYFVSEFGGPAEGGEDHSSSDIPTPTAERSDEAFGNVVFTNIELETSDDLTSAVAEVANVSEPEHCPFCRAGYDAQAIVCQRCKAVLTMSDLEMLISNLGADKLLLRDAVERLEAERSSRELSEAELTTLGIGHLNLQNLQYGFNYLLLASELNPNNVVLSGHVNALRIRLEEIKRRDEVHETMTKGKTILVVDDSPTVRKLIAGKLEKSGHDVICATDGVEAIERLREVVPDLVLLDITMPRMDGYQVCKMIRSNSTTQNVPVVMISGKDGFFDKVRGRMAGTTGYITKPFGPDTLMKAVETFLAGGVLSEQVN